MRWPYTGTKNGGIKQHFRSPLERAYAVFLDSSEDVTSWEYEKARLPYIDGFTGEHKTYVCDFRVKRGDVVEHVEIKPVERQYPLDKFLYAQNCLNNWRWITAEELIAVNHK